MGVRLVNWQHAWNRNGPVALRRIEGRDRRGKHVFEVQIYLGDLDPNTVRVELYADGVNGGDRYGRR